MIKLSVAIPPLLSLSLIVAGCAAPPAKPQAPPQQVAKPVAPAVPAEPAGTGPAEVTQAFPASPEPNEVAPEPNEPAAVEMPGMASTEQAVVTEPNLPSTSEKSPPAEAEPNELARIKATEPNEVQPSAVDTQATDTDMEDMAAFYDGYAEILREYVRTDGRVDYESLRRKRVTMRDLLIQADELDPNVYQRWTADEKLAFWINVNNLKMLDIITRNYPIQSSWWLRLTWPPSDIRHIEGIWSNYRFIVMDEEFTLAAVEQRFFHRTFGDPRAFLAITYACRSGPPLRHTPYRGPDLDRQLDEQAKIFLTKGGGIHIDRSKGAVYLSALFKPTWRGKEFVARYGTDKKFKSRLPEARAVLNFITRYLPPDDVYFLEVENYSLEYDNFDWRLNDASLHSAR